jgi:hypothetical protein
MYRNMSRALLAFAIAIGMNFIVSKAHAASVTLTFGDLVNQAPIGSWFNGGTNSFFNGNANNGPQVGPSDGIVFSSNADELRSGTTGHAPSGGSGRFENNPSGANTFTGQSGVLFFPFSSTTKSYLNDAAGFNDISLDYSYINNNASTFGVETVELFSGLNGTGTLLASITLSQSSTTVACKTSGDEFCTWSLATQANFGTAQSVLFGGISASPLNGLEFDDVTLTTTPLPATWSMMLVGLILGVFFCRRTRKISAAFQAV